MTDEWLRKHGGLREYDEATSNWKGFSGKIVGHDGDVELVYDNGTRKLFPAQRQSSSTAGGGARIRTGSLSAVGWSVLFVD